MAEVETTSAGNTTAQRRAKEKEDSRGKRKRTAAVEMAVQAAAVMAVAMAMQAVQDGTRGLGLAEAGRKGF
jgi:hypothetical protein